MVLNVHKCFVTHSILQQQTPQFRCTLCKQNEFCFFVLNPLRVHFGAFLPQSRKDSDHLEPSSSLTAAHHLINPTIVHISRLLEIVESLAL